MKSEIPFINGAFLDPHLLRPETPAWTGHIPFAGWIVEALKPEVFVELGTHAGVSYSAFCQAVVESRLPTKCYAVDTWQGDDQAGQYGEMIYAEDFAYHQ